MNPTDNKKKSIDLLDDMINDIEKNNTMNPSDNKDEKTSIDDIKKIYDIAGVSFPKSSTDEDIKACADDSKQVITPWTVTSESGINYMKLIQQFGSHPIDGNLIKRLEKATNMKVHKYLRRGLFFSHRDLELLINKYESGEEIYLYTGRGPSTEAMHLGHMVPFEFTKYLQEAFGAILVIQMSDDEKFYFKKSGTIEDYTNLGYENAKDIIARGFDSERTYIFNNSEEITRNPGLIKNVIMMNQRTKGSTIEAIFGLSSSTSGVTVGQLAWPVYQSVPAFASSFKEILGENIFCLVPMAIDQDPYFRLARDFAGDMKKRGIIKPAVIHSEFLPALGGVESKMSSTVDSSVIFLTDTPNQIKNKINRHAFSGGGAKIEDQRSDGANLEKDVTFQYLLYFHDSDEELAEIARKYSSGEMLTSEIKAILVNEIQRFVAKHQELRLAVDKTVLDVFYSYEKTFNKTRPVRETIELSSDEEYSKMGINFDRYFGTRNTNSKPSAAARVVAMAAATAEKMEDIIKISSADIGANEDA
jgi:tryptophanyl-tRNA synthetase